MSKQVLLDLTPTGVILYPCFLKSYGFNETHKALVVFLLELDTDNLAVAKSVSKINRHVLFDEAELHQYAQTRGLSDPYSALGHEEEYNPKAPPDDSKELVVYGKTQRLSVLLPYTWVQNQKNTPAQSMFGDEIDLGEQQKTYAHLTSRQILEFLDPKKHSTCQLVPDDVLETRFFECMNPNMRRFFRKHISQASQLIGVPTPEGTNTFSSAFGRFLLYKDGTTLHESAAADDEAHLFYYHHSAPKLTAENESFKKDLFEVVMRTVAKTPNHTTPAVLLEELFAILEEKPESDNDPLLKPLKDSDCFDASGYLLRHLKKDEDNHITPKQTPYFFKIVSQVLYICLSDIFFKTHNKLLEVDSVSNRICIAQALQVYEKAKQHTQDLIDTTKEKIPYLLKLKQPTLPQQENKDEFYEPNSKQAVVGVPMATLLMGLIQSVVDYKTVVGTEANPMLILTSALSKYSIYGTEAIFSLSNRNNRSAASLIELTGRDNITIMSRYAGSEVDFGKDVVLSDSVYVSSLDRKSSSERSFLKFYQQNNDREYTPFALEDLSLYEASQAIAQQKNNQFSQVKAGVLISPYNNIDVNSDLNRFLFWLVFFYEQVRVLRFSGTLVGLSEDVHLIAFFHPRGRTLDYEETIARFGSIVGFGNVPHVSTLEGIVNWVSSESLFVLTQDIFLNKSTEKALVDKQTLVQTMKALNSPKQNTASVSEATSMTATAIAMAEVAATSDDENKSAEDNLPELNEDDPFAILESLESLDLESDADVDDSGMSKLTGMDDVSTDFDDDDGDGGLDALDGLLSGVDL